MTIKPNTAIAVNETSVIKTINGFIIPVYIYYNAIRVIKLRSVYTPQLPPPSSTLGIKPKRVTSLLTFSYQPLPDEYSLPITVLGSIFSQSIFFDRYLLMTIPAFALLLASLRRKYFLILVLIMVCLLVGDFLFQ